ncbi:MAG: DUF6261 family protein [Prevotellaceae bacterium]|jgi:hypothetical protein|nr:DUF6261 family protein [Prevotellaceae bacterium]
MKEFLTLTLSKLNRGAYFNLLMTIYTLAMANKTVAQKAAKYLAALKLALDHVDEALAIVRKSELTERIVALNNQRLSFLASLKSVVKSLLKLDATAEDAKMLLHLFKDYGIKRGMQIDQLTGLFTNLIGDLEGKAAPAVKALKLQELVTDIKQSNEELKQLTKDRMDAQTKNGTGQLKTARAEADKALRDLFKIIESYVWVEGEAPYADFIDRVNAEIKHYKQEALGEKVKEKIPGNNDNQGAGGNDDGEEEPPQG